MRRALLGRTGSARALGAAVPSGALAVALAVAVPLAALRAHAKPWNAASFRDALAGKVLVSPGAGAGIVSLAGQGFGEQRVLVRADLLVRDRTLAATSLQLEYLPSGTVCTGVVTDVERFGFTGRCRLPDGAQRVVTASWAPAGTTEVHGRLGARPV